jgi:tRNA (guanine-N1)-methyltransferase
MRADVIERALLSLSLPSSSSALEDKASSRGKNAGRLIYMSPRGKVLNQALVQELAKEQTLTILCGRYEGVDQRVLDAHEFEEISIGDYVLSGGEPAALILMDACIRLLPGVMGNEATPDEESFAGGLLEYPHYTRPADWVAADGQVYPVPEVLKSGHHGDVKKWRHEQAKAITAARRPDLIHVLLQKDTKTQRKDEKDIEVLGKIIVDCAFHVHKELGPGLLESVYEAYLYQKLIESGLNVEKQKPIKIEKGKLNIDMGFRADMIVNDCILIELKAVETIAPVHKAQVISYLKLTGYRLGYLINFNSALIKDGIRRFVN